MYSLLAVFVTPCYKGFYFFYPPMAASVDSEVRFTGTRISANRLHDDSNYCSWEKYVHYIKLIVRISISSWNIHFLVKNIYIEIYIIQTKCFLYLVEIRYWSSEFPFFEHPELYVDNSHTAKKHLIVPNPPPSYCKMKKTISRGFFY